MRHTPIKKRSQSAYQNKVNKITKWYTNLINFRKENPEIINVNTKQETKRKTLKSLEYYIDLLKRPQGEK